MIMVLIMELMLLAGTLFRVPCVGIKLEYNFRDLVVTCRTNLKH